MARFLNKDSVITVYRDKDFLIMV